MLDLYGDGLDASAAEAGVYFDIDGGAFAKRTGWVGAGDGLLARDLNGNGAIDGIGELFGSRTQGGYCSLAGRARVPAANDNWRDRLAA